MQFQGESSMTARKLRHLILSAYCNYREDGGPRLTTFFNRSYRLSMLAVLLLVAGYAVGASYFEAPPVLTGFVIGVLVGRLLVDLRYYKRTQSFWPTLDAILDWNRIYDALGRESRSGQVQEHHAETGICERPH
jgi:hypothetical protein